MNWIVDMIKAAFLPPQSLRQELGEMLNKALGRSAVDDLPEYPVRNIAGLRKIGKETAPRLRRRFLFAKDAAASIEDIASLAHSVANTCEDVFVLISALRSHAGKAAKRGGLDGDAAAEAVEHNQKVQATLQLAIDLVRKFDILASDLPNETIT